MCHLGQKVGAHGQVGRPERPRAQSRPGVDATRSSPSSPGPLPSVSMTGPTSPTSRRQGHDQDPGEGDEKRSYTWAWSMRTAPRRAPASIVTTASSRRPICYRAVGDGAVCSRSGDGQGEHSGGEVGDGELAGDGVLHTHGCAEDDYEAVAVPGRHGAPARTGEQR